MSKPTTHKNAWEKSLPIRRTKLRTYLVVIDETEESRTALHYAAVRAIRLGRTVEIEFRKLF